MEGKFLVTSTFTVEARNIFVITGHVIDGKVTAGMVVSIPIDDDSVLDADIESIEAVNTMDDTAPIGLAVRYQDDEELDILQALEIAGKRLDVFAG